MVRKLSTYSRYELNSRVDWQLKWDTPALIRNDHIRRCLEYHRQLDAGTYEDTLSPARLETDFDVASPDVQQAVGTQLSAYERGQP